MTRLKLGEIEADVVLKDIQRKLRQQERETRREYLDRESHFVWGSRYLLTIVEADAAPRVTLEHRRLILQVRPASDTAKKASVLDEWYREQLKAALPPLLAKWEPLLGLKVERFFVQRMKTRWGSCSHESAAAWQQHRALTLEGLAPRGRWPRLARRRSRDRRRARRPGRLLRRSSPVACH